MSSRAEVSSEGSTRKGFLLNFLLNSLVCWQNFSSQRTIGLRTSVSTWLLARSCPHFFFFFLFFLSLRPLKHSNLLHQSQQGREPYSKTEVTNLCNLITKVAFHHFCHILHVFRPSHTARERIQNSVNTKRQLFLEPAYQSWTH